MAAGGGSKEGGPVGIYRVLDSMAGFSGGKHSKEFEVEKLNMAEVRRVQQIQEAELQAVPRLPGSPSLSGSQSFAAICGKKYRAALKGLFDNNNMVLNHVSDLTMVKQRVFGRCSTEIGKTVLASVKRMYAMSVSGGGVDYTVLSQSMEFTDFCLEAECLWLIDPSELNEKERKAFFINVYNALIIHAVIVFGKPDNSTDRMHFYSRASYAIGGRIYSLNDIEHGILRENRMSWQPIPVRPFSEYDARLSCATKFDPRIHFALNCGAKGCPMLRFYDAQTLDESLDAAAQVFLSDVVVDEASHSVTLSSIFSWYVSDFANSKVELLWWIMPYLNKEQAEALGSMLHASQSWSGEVKVNFFPYDWRLNHA